MANNYESLKTDGHYTLARRIFQKIKNKYLTYVNYSPIVSSNEIVGIGFTETNDSGIIQYFVLGKGDNITFTQVGNSSTYNISADQIEDSYDYDEYEDLPSATKMLDKLFICEDAPAPSFFRYESNTKTLIFENGYATYDEDTKTLTIGG